MKKLLSIVVLLASVTFANATSFGSNAGPPEEKNQVFVPECHGITLQVVSAPEVLVYQAPCADVTILNLEYVFMSFQESVPVQVPIGLPPKILCYTSYSGYPLRC